MKEDEAYFYLADAILLFLKLASVFMLLVVLMVAAAGLLDYSPRFRNLAARMEMRIRQRVDANHTD